MNHNDSFDDDRTTEEDFPNFFVWWFKTYPMEFVVYSLMIVGFIIELIVVFG